MKPTAFLSVGLAALTLACATPGRAQATRDPFLWPFSQGSIWNTPLGSSASYHEIDLPKVGACRTDTEYLALTASTDPTYTWHDIYTPSHTESVQMPAHNPVVPSGSDNHCVAIVEPNGRVYQSDNSTRPDNSDLYGALVGFDYWQTFGITNVTDDGTYGAHLGSGLSVLGGSIRAWEIQSSNDYVIQHAIKIELDHYLLWKNSSNPSQSYIWPADRADSDTSDYGTYKNDPALAEGSLLALSPNATINSLGITTAVGRKLFHALQDYGAYVVDTSGANYRYGDHDYIANICEEEPAQAIFALDCNENDAGAFYNDLNAMYQNLYAVSNNTSNNIGGGGTPRRNLAPPFGTLGDGSTGGGTVDPPVITPSGSAPIGQRIALKANANGYYVSADANNSQVLEAKFANAVGSWEQFDVVDAGNGEVALRSASTGYYVTCYLNNNNLLIANSATTIQAWEKFTWQDLGSGAFALKSSASGYYVSCDLNDPNQALRAAFATSVQGWETFQSTVQSASPAARQASSARTASPSASASPTKTVTITDKTAGATIRYTTDGSTPTVTSAAYTGPLSVAANTTIKAVGFKSGWKTSTVSAYTYTYNFPPAAPTSLAATAGSGQVSLNWPAVSGAASYSLFRGTAAGGEAATAVKTGITGTSYTDTSLANGTTYFYKLKAVNSYGTSGSSNEASAKPVAAVTTVTVDDTTVGTGVNQFSYVGSGWQAQTGYTGYGYYNNSEHYSNHTGDYFTVKFTGTKIAFYAGKNNGNGIAGVSIDGGTEVQADTYANVSDQGNVLVYTSAVLASGSHTLKVRVTGSKNASSSGTYISPDRVVVTP